MDQFSISLSIVSHGQADLVAQLLRSIEEYCADSILEVLLTQNTPESLPFSLESYSFPIRLITNETPKGFGANHNSAFFLASGQYFCVLNPDALFVCNPFKELMNCLLQDNKAGVVAPLIINSEGLLEDSARSFPTPFSIIKKAFRLSDGQRDVMKNTDVCQPDWIGGMFMLFPKLVYESMKGFDERYFLYYEDVELCARLRLVGLKVLQCSSVSVVHNARRESHRNFTYFKWHLTSILRFFASPAFWRIAISRLLKRSGVRSH